MRALTSFTISARVKAQGSGGSNESRGHSRRVLVRRAVSSPAGAWGAKGHQYIGALAEGLLKANAASQVRTILGHDLGVSAVWADCIRDVNKKPDETFRYIRSPYTPVACHTFEAAGEKARMEDYAARNWTNCQYSGRWEECHKAFHFADVAIQHGRYDRAYFGTSDHDVVYAIKAALDVLQDKPSPAPFNIRDKKEALFLLAHFVGDLHQPLHVGSVYLDPNGQLIDPDATPGDDAAAETRGGNSLTFGADDKDNMHSDWDAIASSYGVTPSSQMVARAKGVQATAGALGDRPVTWATESVVAARSAFVNVTFAGAGAHHWKATFASRPFYVTQQRTLQAEQLAEAGARLAELLNAIWPTP
jgi:hypothetical protein